MTDRLDAALVDLAERGRISADTRTFVLAEQLVESSRRRLLVPLPRALVLALIALLFLAAAAAALVLGVPGLRLTLVPSQPTASVPADPLGARLALGAAVPVDEVADLAPDALGPPDEAYVIGDGAITSLVYAAGDGAAGARRDRTSGSWSRPSRARSIASRWRSWSARSVPA